MMDLVSSKFTLFSTFTEKRVRFQNMSPCFYLKAHRITLVGIKRLVSIRRRLQARVKNSLFLYFVL